MNNKMNFDPMTGKPINNNINNLDNPITYNETQNNNLNQVNVPPVVPETAPNVMPVTQVPTTETIQSTQNVQPTNTIVTSQQQIQNIPTVDQTKQEFINNTQTDSAIKKEEKKDSPNIAFIAILFIIIFAAIFFLFPYLMNILQ